MECSVHSSNNSMGDYNKAIRLWAHGRYWRVLTTTWRVLQYLYVSLTAYIMTRTACAGHDPYTHPDYSSSLILCFYPSFGKFT
jgi:hypothetical protein